ncbi:MAG TPA: hypothetical protein VIT44_08335 [Cyclobacteriaceae bacterium]
MTTNTDLTIKSVKIHLSASENQKGIDNHRRIATYLEAAAKNHLYAAKHHENGEHEKAAQCTIIAMGFHRMAGDAQREDLRHHALNG